MIMPGAQDYFLSLDRLCTSVWAGTDPKAALGTAAAEWDQTTERLGVDQQKAFYTEFLGLGTEEFNLGWVARFTNPETGARVQLVTRDATSPEDSVMSVHTDDVDAAWAQAQEMGLEVVRPLTKEAWGVRRFLVRAPDGNVVNIVDHRD